MAHSVLNYLIVLAITLCCTAVDTESQTRSELNAAVQQEASYGKYQLIEVEQLKELYLDESKDILLVDTRQEWEYRTGHITNAVHFSMEPTWFERLIQRHALAQVLGPDKEANLVFY